MIHLDHTDDDTSIKYDENGIFEKGILRRSESISWTATYVVTLVTVELGKCSSIPGFYVETFTLCSILALSILIIRIKCKK